MNNNTKNILLGVLVVGLVGMTIAYAALSTRLQISGTATVADTRWDIHLADFTAQNNVASLVAGQANTGNPGTVPSITNGTAITGLAVTLNQPGDVVKYNFKIVNGGSIDAKLSSFTDSLTLASSSTTTMNQNEIDARFTHNITCNPTQATTADSLNKSAAYLATPGNAGSNNDVAECTLTISWLEAGIASAQTPNAGGQASQTAGQDQTYTQGAATLDYSASWVYTQK